MAKEDLAQQIVDPFRVTFTLAKLSPQASVLANELDLVNFSWAPSNVRAVAQAIDGLEIRPNDIDTPVDLDPLRPFVASTLKKLGVEFHDLEQNFLLYSTAKEGALSQLDLQQHAYSFSFTLHPAAASFRARGNSGLITLPWSTLVAAQAPSNVDHEELHSSNYQRGLIQGRLYFEFTVKPEFSAKLRELFPNSYLLYGFSGDEAEACIKGVLKRIELFREKVIKNDSNITPEEKQIIAVAVLRSIIRTSLVAETCVAATSLMTEPRTILSSSIKGLEKNLKLKDENTLLAITRAQIPLRIETKGSVPEITDELSSKLTWKNFCSYVKRMEGDIKRVVSLRNKIIDQTCSLLNCPREPIDQYIKAVNEESMAFLKITF